MFYFILLFLEIVTLFLLSKRISKALPKFLSTNFLSFLFLPGVIIHEFSHMLIAVILFVPVGNMEFSPKNNEGGLKLGSIEIAKTDPIRRSIIGFAPVFVGFMIVVGIVYLFMHNISFFQDKSPYILGAVSLAITYLLFVISNTMFSSSRDMEGAIEILITLIIIFGAAYILGFRFPDFIIDFVFSDEVIGLIKKAILFLLAPVAIDLTILAIIKMHKK